MGNEADFIFLDGRQLLSATTREWTSPVDLTYHVLNLLDIYGVKPQESSVRIQGLSADQIEDSALGRFVEVEAAESR